MTIEDFYIGQKVRSVNNMSLKAPYTVTGINKEHETVDVQTEDGKYKYPAVAHYLLAPWPWGKK